MVWCVVVAAVGGDGGDCNCDCCLCPLFSLSLFPLSLFPLPTLSGRLIVHLALPSPTVTEASAAALPVCLASRVCQC